MSNNTEMEPHEYADIFPVIEGDALNDLVEDIKEHGLHTPIVTYQGKILDGRNRHKACELAGIKLDPDKDFREYDDDDPLSYVVSLNIHRRHLNESQRSMIASKIANMNRGDNQHASIEATSQTDAAKMLNVSRSSVQRATKITEKGIPELPQAVTKGTISVNQASKISKFPKEEQRIVFESMQEKPTGNKKDKKTIPAPYTSDIHMVLGGIDLDPFSNKDINEDVKADQFFTKEDNGLEQDWDGRIWLRLPRTSGNTAQYAEKLIAEYKSGNCTDAIMLCPVNTDMAWFQDLAKTASAICFPCSETASIETESPHQNAKHALCYLGKDAETFTNVFSKHGIVLYSQKP